jgi:Lon protease-like protein
MLLSGVCRFDLGEELSTTRGYRLIVPNWSRCVCDYEDNEARLQADKPHLLAVLEHDLEVHGLEAEQPMFERMAVENLIDALTMAPPFTQQEKQMLQGAVEPQQRPGNFITLISDDIAVPDSATRHQLP